jgi:uracil-DNA glycosylase family 4
MNPKDEQELALCEECTLKECKYVPIYIPEENGFETDLPVLFIGEAPGEVESMTKRPFTGPAGKMHYSCLLNASLNQNRFPHSNVCSCWPPGNRDPTPFEARCCFPRLMNEIHSLRPKLIVALGAVAMEALTEASGKISSNRGRVLPLKEAYNYQCDVLISLHPSFVRRSRQWIPSQIQTYELINDYFNKGIKEELNPKFLYDPDPNELRHYLKREDIIYGTDTETTGLDVLADDILGHSFSDGETACAVYYSGGEDDPRWEVVKEFLEDPKKQKCWQNGSYDTEIARSKGILDQGFAFDTRLAQQMLYSDLPSDLDHLRNQWTNIRPYKPTKKEIRRIKHWPKEKMLEYACWDAITTYKVMEAQKKELHETQDELMTNLLVPLVRAIGRIHRRGFLVDVPRLASLYAQCEPLASEIYNEFASLGVNPRSPQQVARLFEVKTTGFEHLTHQINRQHPKAELMQRLLTFRMYDRLATMYLRNIYKRLKEGRIHTTFKIEGTGTGRLASENPNLQNVPDEMRVIYIPDPGYTLIDADYSQIELWVAAIIIKILSGDESLLESLQTGIDVHYEACKLCFSHRELKYGNRKQDFTHRESNIAKSIVFGTFYGRTPRSIGVEFGVSDAEAQSWQLKIMNKYPGLAKYREHVERSYVKQGMLETPFGRVRYLQDLRQGYNFPIQSTASDITLGSIVALDEAGFEILATVHDSIILQIPTNKFEEKTKEVKRIMERPIPELLNTSFPTGYAEGPNWYDVAKFTP